MADQVKLGVAEELHLERPAGADPRSVWHGGGDRDGTSVVTPCFEFESVTTDATPDRSTRRENFSEFQAVSKPHSTFELPTCEVPIGVD
jgi:hypothetical protein